MTENHIVLFDSIKNIKHNGEFSGSIISKTLDPQNHVIFSDSIKISDEEGIIISEGLFTSIHPLTKFSSLSIINPLNLDFD